MTVSLKQRLPFVFEHLDQPAGKIHYRSRKIPSIFVVPTTTATLAGLRLRQTSRFNAGRSRLPPKIRHRHTGSGTRSSLRRGGRWLATTSQASRWAFEGVEPLPFSRPSFAGLAGVTAHPELLQREGVADCFPGHGTTRWFFRPKNTQPFFHRTATNFPAIAESDL